MTEDGAISTVRMEELRMRLNARISGELANLSMEVAVEAVSKTILAIADVSIFAQRLDQVTVSYPATWWQHFKLAFFPEWLCEWFPIVEIREVMRLYGAYPKMPAPDIQKYGAPHYMVKKIEDEEV